MSYPGGNAATFRHWPFFLGQGANWIYGIGTEGGGCNWPQGINGVREIGADKYVDGEHLPRRLLDTIENMLLLPWRKMIIAEYDVCIFKPLPAEEVKTFAAHRAGAQTWGSKAKSFYHWPFIFARDTAIEFLMAGKVALEDGICPPREPHGASTPECSPDVFTGFVLQESGIVVQEDLYTEFSRNSFDVPGDLEKARQAYRDGVDCCHGIKTAEELAFILS